MDCFDASRGGAAAVASASPALGGGSPGSEYEAAECPSDALEPASIVDDEIDASSVALLMSDELMSLERKKV
jgi:hypothetical protein